MVALLIRPADDGLLFAEPALLVHQQGSVAFGDLEDREYLDEASLHQVKGGPSLSLTFCNL